MKYLYSVLPVIDEHGGIQFIKRPLVDIEVFGPKGVAKVLALIDSGADRSLFHIDIAREVGLDLTTASQSRMMGIVGGAEVLVLEEAEMRVEGLRPRVKIPVGFINSPHVIALLGQDGFFDNFRIAFEKSRDAFEITPVKR